MPHEFCVCLCVGWVCAVLSVVGLGALLCRVRVCLVWINSLYAQLPLSNSLYSRCVVNGLLSVRFMDFGCVFGCTVPSVPAFVHDEMSLTLKCHGRPDDFTIDNAVAIAIRCHGNICATGDRPGNLWPRIC